MAAPKFRIYEITKANAEVERLEALINDRDTALKAAQEEITNLKAAAAPAEGEVTQLRADLTTSKQTIKTLEGQMQAKDAEITNLKAEVQSAKAETAAAKESAAKAASTKALEITASQGQPPLELTAPKNAPKADKSGTVELKGLDRAIAAHKANPNA